MTKTSVGRVAHLIPVLELLEEEHALFVQAEHDFAAQPRRIKDNLESKTERRLFDDLALDLLEVNPAARRERATRLGTMIEALRQQIEDDRADPNDVDGPLFASDDLQLVTEFLNMMSGMQGSRNRRELGRFFDAVRSGDVAYIILKNEPNHPKAPIEARFQHHLSSELASELRLAPIGVDEPVTDR